MEQGKNKNAVVLLLVVIIVILFALVALLATGTISFKSNESITESTNGNTNGSTTEIDNQDNTTIESLINSVKITNFTFDKPGGSSLGGGVAYTLGTNMTIDLECTNDIISGLTVKGYCLDLDDNKYLFSGPVGLASGISCSNDSTNYFAGSTVIIKADGSHYDTHYSETSGINWENIKTKYCKFDEAHLVLSDGSMLQTKIELNYEKEFK